MKILVIDDQDQMRRLMVRILAGHDVLTADDGAQGMKVFRSEKPELVITDLIMPEQEGVETILALRRESPDLKIIAMSGSGGDGDNISLLKMAQALGADGVIEKPFRSEDLRRLVDRVTADCA